MKMGSWSFVGFCLWLAWLFLARPFDPFALPYVSALVLAAALWLIPLAWELTRSPEWYVQMGLPAASLLAISFLLDQGWEAAVFAMPWLVLTLAVAHHKWRRRKLCIWKAPADLSHLLAFVYLPVGAIWAVADRLGFQPMGFSPAIVLLTVAHFHYAGFILPLLTGWVVGHLPGRWIRIAAYGVAMGIPLTAIGITSSQFHLPHFIEMLCASIMALSGLMIGIGHLVLFRMYRGQSAAIYWLLGGLALSAGMCLALLYAWRSVFPLAFLSIPWMHAVHGSLNALGFALPALLGWSLHLRRKPIRQKELSTL
ncbi:MAG: YndJ family transporter [Bacteroidota bacterium]